MSANCMILAGDIGGTHTRLALFDKGRLMSIQEYPSKRYSGLEKIVSAYLEEQKAEISLASFGIAGPVRNGVCKATNLPWWVDTHQLAQVLQIDTVHLLNDLMANAYGLLVLQEKDLLCLQKGNGEKRGNRALIAAGTGLGEAGLYWDGKKYCPFASEGGHTDFAPRNELEVELFFYLREKFGHVSCERVVSGPGLYAIYQFFVDTGREKPSLELIEAIKQKDPTMVISQWGVKNRDAACARAVELFITLYGAEAGNLALNMLAFGGVYIGGGIAPHLVEVFQRELFLEAFRDKGRFDGLLETIPVSIILNEHTALLGAAVFAEYRLES